MPSDTHDQLPPRRWWKRYRIIEYRSGGFDEPIYYIVECWRLWWPFWMQPLGRGNFNSNIESARRYAHRHNADFVVEESP